MALLEQKLTSSRLQRVFTLTLVLFLMVLTLSSLDFIRERVKDTKRLADIKQLQTALALYQSQFNALPEVEDNDFNGWDTTIEPLGQPQEFLNILSEKKIIDRIPRDPVNSQTYFYRYQKFPANSFGCDRPFYILQIINFEGNVHEHGFGACPQRNFADEAPNGYTVQVFE